MKDKIAEGIIKGFSVQDFLASIKAKESKNLEGYIRQIVPIKLWEHENQKEYDITALKEFITEYLNCSDNEKKLTLFNEIVELLGDLAEDIRKQHR